MPDIQDITPRFQPVTSGTNRNDRVLPALDPTYVQIDSGEVIDKVFYTLKMAANYQYFNISGIPEGTWDTLLQQSPYFKLAIIYKYDVIKLISDNEGEEAILNALDGTGKSALEACLARLTSNLHGNKPGGTVSGDVSDWISSFAQCEDEQLKNFYFHLVNINGELGKIYTTLQDISTRLNNEKSVDRAQLNDLVIQVKDALKKLKRYFHSLNKRAKDVFNNQLGADKNMAPHIALLLGFLQLYDSQRLQLNSLTARHLDYCYSDLLGLVKSAAKADSAYVAFTLTDTPGTNSFKINSGTALDAGNDTNDQTISFNTNQDIVVTQTSVPEFKALFISHLSKFNQPGTGVEEYYSENLNDDQKAITESALNIITIPGGDEQFTDEDLGLVIASPLFFIEDGHATIVLTLTLNGLGSQIIKNIGSSPFSIYITSAKGWRKVGKYSFSTEGEQMVIKFGYDAMAYPITSYDNKNYTEGYTLDIPAIKINLRRLDVVSPYIYMVNLVISKVGIGIQVSRNQKVRIQTNLGLVGLGNPFQAFGPAPQLGSYFDIRNANIFNKYLDSLKIHIQWMGLPPKAGGFDSYYEKYNCQPFNAELSNKEFKVNLEALTGSGNNYSPLNITSQNEFLLFDTLPDISRDKKVFLNDKSVIAIQAKDNHLGFHNGYSLANEPNLDFSKPGIIRLTLISPDAGFGFELFPSVLAYYVAKNARNSLLQAIFALRGRANETKDSSFDDAKKLPNQPYIPVIKSLAVDYELNFSRQLSTTGDSNDNQLTIIHIYPFGGYKTVYPFTTPAPESPEPECRLLPQFNKGNNLFIRLANFENGGPLSLLFTLKDSLIENDFGQPAPVSWSYLKNNQWTDIDSLQITSDSTNAFTQNGIVNINVPNDLTTDNTLMPSGSAWILAATDDDDPDNTMIRNFAVIVGAIQNNAVSATRNIFGQSDPGSLALAENKITQLVTRVPQIASVLQPLPSFGGVAAMSSGSYYLSMSERLRHKNRPISAWEMERIVLDKFQGIKYVKCINYKTNSKHIPRFEPRPDILVIVVSDGILSSTGSQPRVPFAILASIKSFLTRIISADLNIAVTNPHNERLRIKCAVKFKDGDTSKTNDFDKDFKAFLTPWLYDRGKNVEIISTIHIADIMGYLSNRPYVENITDMVLVHIFEKGLVADTGIEPPEDTETEIEDDTEYLLEEIADNRAVNTFLPYGMFVAAPSFFTNIIEPGDDSTSPYMGIGELFINDDFRLSERNPAGQPDPGINTHIAEGKLSFVINVPNKQNHGT